LPAARRITESKNGIYLGIRDAKQEIHISYHQDGTEHGKLGTDYHNCFSDVQIASHKGARQLYHVSLPIKNPAVPSLSSRG
jgi:hypothetical protein